MALHKMVDGKTFELTPKEEQELKDEWAANAAKQLAPPSKQELQQQLESLAKTPLPWNSVAEKLH